MGSSTKRKQVRAFLSSTFSDFMEERDLLAKQVFPSLRRKARERGVEIVDVDLEYDVYGELRRSFSAFDNEEDYEEHLKSENESVSEEVPLLN